MNDKKLEISLREMLHDCAAGIDADDRLKTRIHASIHTPRARRSHRKLVIGVAAALCLTLMGALARGPVVSLVSRTHVNSIRTEIAALQKDAGRVMDDVILPETLAGYAFHEGSVSYTDKLDAAGNSLGRYPGMDAYYQLGGSRLNLSASVWDTEVDSMDDRTPDSMRHTAGVEMSYKADAYIFLPEGEKPTAEEQARMEAGELYISYGTDARESYIYQYVHFRLGEITYQVYTNDERVTEEMLYDAAKQMIMAAK